MGWDYTHGASKQDIVRERIAPRTWDTGAVRTVASRVVGGVLWTVRDHTHPDGRLERYIGCDLLQGTPGGWGYKDLDEHSHPYYYSCPLAYLDIAPVACQEWREGVHKWHGDRAARRAVVASLTVGATVALLPGCKPESVEITSLTPLMGTRSGRLYRIQPRHLRLA
jgi:hypothetical protein